MTIGTTVELNATELRALREQRHAVPVAHAIFRLDGAGAVDCVQGILTNDVVRPGPQSLVWGAILTPKGMIIADSWVRRDGPVIWLIAPALARTSLHDLLRRSFPPRLARVTDCTDHRSVRWLVGGSPTAIDGCDVARPDGVAPFAGLVLTETPDQTDVQLAAAGWHAAPAYFADAAKLIVGWPSLGREIDERTLPQEARFDELGGVRYDKGCYTGQETVARLHFRGHANRLLRGVQWASGDGPSDDSIRQSDKLVGTLRTVGRLGHLTVALATIRHEIALGEAVTAGGTEAVVVGLPFDLGTPAVA